MHNEETLTSICGVSLSAVGTALQTNDVLQTISLIITILGGVISFVIIPLINWHKQAKADGKITKDELKEGTNIIKEGITKVIKEKEDKTK